MTATGKHTYFGKTAELVKTAKTASHLQEIIFAIVKYLVILDAALVGALLVYAGFAHLPWSEVLPFALILLVASVPVALPGNVHGSDGARRARHVPSCGARDASFRHRGSSGDGCPVHGQNRNDYAEPTCRGADLSDRRVEAPTKCCAWPLSPPMQRLRIPSIWPFSRPHKKEGAEQIVPRRIQFIPFDPATKRSEAIYEQPAGQTASRQGRAGCSYPSGSQRREALRAKSNGSRRAGREFSPSPPGTEHSLELVGLLGLEDPIREDSEALVQNLKGLGVRVIMVTGDGPATARAVSLQVGIGDRVGSAESLRDGAAVAAEQLRRLRRSFSGRQVSFGSGASAAGARRRDDRRRRE